jgi:hypothetical protein
MAADIFTKFFPEKKREIWKNVRRNINVLTPAEIVELAGTPGQGYLSVLDKPKQALALVDNESSAVAVESLGLLSVGACAGLVSLCGQSSPSNGKDNPSGTDRGGALLSTRLTNRGRQEALSLGCLRRIRGENRP